MKEITHTYHYMQCSLDELSGQDRQLIEAAKQAAQQSYAPYSESVLDESVRD